MRKNPTVWDAWDAGKARGLHSVQLAILLRGLELLNPGGLFVYSTCSFSPVENEAVVAAALRHFGAAAGAKGQVELLPARLPGLRVKPGLHSWRVPCAGHPAGILSASELSEAQGTKLSGAQKKRLAKEAARNAKEAEAAGGAGEMPSDGAAAAATSAAAAAGGAEPGAAAADTPDEAAPAPLTQRRAQRMAASLFAPSAEEAAAMQLERCLRLLPHAQDTGGFFCALLRKRTAEEMRQVEERPDETAGQKTAPAGSKIAAAWLRSRGRAPPAHSGAALAFTRVSPASQPAARLCAFYGLGDAFPWPRLLTMQAEADGESPGRRLYLVSAAAAAALASLGGDGSGDGSGGGLAVLQAGVKVFERDACRAVGCEYRITQDGAHALLPWLTRRARRATPAAMAALLEARSMPLPETEGGAINTATTTTDTVNANASSINATTNTTNTTTTTAGGDFGCDDAQEEEAARAAGPLGLDGLLGSLARMRANGCALLVCEGVGEGGQRCRVVATAMKWTSEVVLFLSDAERETLLGDVRGMRAEE